MKKWISLLCAVILVFAICSPVFAEVTDVTATVVNADPKEKDDTYTFVFKGKFKTTEKGEIKYRWNRSDDAKGPELTKTVEGPGEYSVPEETWQLGKEWKGHKLWEQLEILSPNVKKSDKADITVP